MDQGVQRLVTEVEKESRAEATSAIERARSIASSILQEARARAEAERQGTLAAAARDIEQIKRRGDSAARLAAEHRLQGRREEVIGRVFAQVRSRLAAGVLTREERSSSLVRLIEEAARALGGGSLLVAVGAADRDLLTPNLLRQVEQSLREAGVAAELTPSQDTPEIRGGAVLTTRDGRLRFDNSWEARLDRLTPSLRSTVWHVLSGETTEE